jgi:hypothetical protein
MDIHTIIKNKPHVNLVERMRDAFGRSIQQKNEVNTTPVIAVPGPMPERRLVKNQAEYSNYIDKFDYTIAKRESEISFQALAKQGLNVSIARCFSSNRYTVSFSI